MPLTKGSDVCSGRRRWEKGAELVVARPRRKGGERKRRKWAKPEEVARRKLDIREIEEPREGEVLTFLIRSKVSAC